MNKMKDTTNRLILGAMSLLMIGLMVSCGDTPTMTEPFEATGEIQGSVIDRATGDAISGVGVTLNYRVEDSDGNLDEDFTDTKTTDAQGRFVFSDVPVNTDAKGGADERPYMVRLDMGGNDDYRSTYLAAIDVVFESTGGDGASVSMTSNITIPLSKRSVDVSGKVLASNRGNEPLDGATVELHQNFNPVINGNVSTSSTMLLSSTNSNSDGEFSFSNVEENATIFVRVRDNSDPTNVINFTSGTQTTPSSSDGSAVLSLGTIMVTGIDESSRFNVTVQGIAVQEGTQTPLEDVEVGLRQFNTSEILETTTTEEDGSFEFTGVEENQTMTLVFKKLDDESEVYDETMNFQTPRIRGEQEIVEDLGKIELEPEDRTGFFYIASVTPEQGADLESDELVFVYTFNRSVIENSYTRDDLGFGSGTFKDNIQFSNDGPKKLFPGDVDFTVEWSENRSVLTITPDPDDLVDATNFTLMVGDALIHNRFTDVNDNTLAFNQQLPFNNPAAAVTREFSINDNNTPPHTPDVDLVTEDIDWDQQFVQIEWIADESDADIRQYEVWTSRDGAPFEHDTNLNPDNFAFGEMSYTVNMGNDRLVNRRNGIPDEAIDFRIRVRAISTNLVEGEYSDIITISDEVDPVVVSANRVSGTVLEVFFNEPLDKATAENPGNYSFVDDDGDALDMDIESIVYEIDGGIGGDAGNPKVTITLDEDSEDEFSAAADEVVIVSGVTDLAGNEVDDDDEEDDRATYN